jgi:hypothetical protein
MRGHLELLRGKRRQMQAKPLVCSVGDLCILQFSADNDTSTFMSSGMVAKQGLRPNVTKGTGQFSGNLIK